jgi:hypothetical protein
MFVRGGRCVVAVALCLSIGGHWIGLESIAWATMVVNYSQQCSIAEALERTFDGDHPCDLCKKISQSKNNEKKHDTQRGTAKVDLICVVRQFAFLPPFAPYDYHRLITSATCGSHKPPSPPPCAQFA